MDEDIRIFVRRLAVERNLSPYTLTAYRSDLQDLARCFPTLSLREVSCDQIRDYVERLQQKGLKGSTVRRRLATLRVFYGAFEAEGAIRESPVRRLRHRYAAAKQLPRVMPISHVETMLKEAHRASVPPGTTKPSRLWQARARRDLAILDTLFATGMRSCEVVKLDLRDIDLERRTLLVNGKGRRQREIYVSSDEVLANIQAYLESRPLFAPKEDAVFLNPKGRRLHVQSVGLIFRRIQRAVGKAGFSPHCLRHTMATLLVENGADLRSTQEILGHSNIRTTEIYVAVSRTRQQVVMTRFNARDRLAIR